MKKYLALYNVFVRSVLAGAMIGFGCIAVSYTHLTLPTILG